MNHDSNCSTLPLAQAFNKGEIKNNYYYYPGNDQLNGQPIPRHGFLNRAKDLVFARSLQVLGKALDLIKYGIQLVSGYLIEIPQRKAPIEKRIVNQTSEPNRIRLTLQTSSARTS